MCELSMASGTGEGNLAKSIDGHRCGLSRGDLPPDPYTLHRLGAIIILPIERLFNQMNEWSDEN